MDIHRAKGVTLVELLVVLAVIAFAASVVVLTVPPARSNARIEADMFAARLAAASEKAILRGGVIGLEIAPDGYRFLQYARGAWSAPEDEWAPLRYWPDDISATITTIEPSRRNERESAQRTLEEAPAPTVFFTPTGETTPLEAIFSAGQKSFRVTMDAAGEIKVDKP